MAMLGMQADMQRNSHFPRHYTAWDLNLDANGIVWPADNVNRIFTNSQDYNGSLPTSSGLSVFNSKDLLKQTMLKHEAEFRDQIHELHRLYSRQKELMGEMKKIDLHKHHLTMETLKSNHILSPKSSNCVQMPQFTSTSLNLMHFHSPVSEAKCRFGKRALARNPLTCSESSSKVPEFMEFNCKKVGNRFLDLELPAVFYIDSDEDVYSEVKTVPEVSDKLRDRVDKKLSNCGSGCNSVFSEGKVNPTNSFKEKVLADFNIPIKIEEDKIPEIGNFQDPVIGHGEVSLCDLFEKSSSNYQVLSEEVIPSNHIVRDQDTNLDIDNLDIDPAIEHRSPAKCTKDFKHVMSVNSFDLNCGLPNLSGCSPEISETTLHDSKLKAKEACNRQDFKRIIGIHTNIPSILSGKYSSHATPARNHQNSSPNKDIKDKEEDMLQDSIKLEVHHVADTGKQLATAKLVAESGPCGKYPGYKVLIDLNTCFSMDESLQIPSQSKAIDLEPPASPENKESSPPRGESDENQLDIPLLSSGQEDVDMQEALIMIAAEALVSFSSSEIHSCSESSNYEPFKASRSNSLHWLARLASSVVNDPRSGVKIDVKDHDDHEEYLSDGIDYFEAMTLNLQDDKVEEFLCRSNGQNEDQSEIFSQNQTKRGRTRQARQQRKDFQSEILPSLASLSRYEVTEDLQTIGGLMEAAGARWENGSSRIAGRNGYAKGRLRSNVHTCTTTETTMNTMRKHQSLNIEDGIQQRRLIDWGKISRRPRGRRCPSSNPRLILGQV